MLDRNKQLGFTLVELLVTVAIVALLVALGLPQYLKFQFRAQRADAILNLNSVHKAQMAYFGAYDHFLMGCVAPIGSNCQPNGALCQIVNDHLGVPQAKADVSGYPLTGVGYRYNWTFGDLVNGSNYELRLLKDLDPRFPGLDEVYIGVRGATKIALNCHLCGWQDSVPYVRRDDITNKLYCPC